MLIRIPAYQYRKPSYNYRWKSLSWCSPKDPVDMLFGGPMPGIMAPMPAMAPNAGAAASGPLAAVDRVRNVFPETWLWSNSTSGYSMQSTNLCLSQKPLYNQRKPKQNISQYHACTCSVYRKIVKLLCVRFELFNETREHFRIYGKI